MKKYLLIFYFILLLEPPSTGSNLIELQDSRQQQMQHLEDEVNLQMLEEQERGIQQLEVYSGVSPVEK